MKYRWGEAKLRDGPRLDSDKNTESSRAVAFSLFVLEKSACLQHHRSVTVVLNSGAVFCLGELANIADIFIFQANAFAISHRALWYFWAFPRIGASTPGRLLELWSSSFLFYYAFVSQIALVYFRANGWTIECKLLGLVIRERVHSPAERGWMLQTRTRNTPDQSVVLSPWLYEVKKP